ncbi:hypothetical protein LC612_31400 [Nostoc sp. CHAB 5834]|nr:hypothetical protein [Nostoc sp. CHAB 5834]
MRKILISGGPVHSHIDSVKIVTNRFRGGLMAGLAESLANFPGAQVTYLTAKSAHIPNAALASGLLNVVFHDGFEDYREKVLALAPDHSDVVLGAAVANLIPANPWPGKFPSHDYNEGDIVNVPFRVTPRVITEVKRVAPGVNLFGFKLLSGAPHAELMKAAWHTLIAGRCAAVIANDATDLQSKYVLTKEGAEHPISNRDLPQFLWGLMNQCFYRTQAVEQTQSPESPLALKLKSLIATYKDKHPQLFVTTPDGMIFGTAAVKEPGATGFWTTGRGKRELDELAYVQAVHHDTLCVFTEGGKSSLNAPLLDNIFQMNPEAVAIVHGHIQDESLPTLPYATPGTVEDSLRCVRGSFNVFRHGCFLVLNAQGEVIR